MTFPDDFKLEELDDIAIMGDVEPDRIAIKIGLICTLYVPHPHDVSVRMSLARCGDEYLALFGKHIKLFLGPEGEGNYKAYPNSGVSLAEYVAENGSPENEFVPKFTGSNSYDDACAYSLNISAVGTEFFPAGDIPAYFAATLPFSFVLDRLGQSAFQNLVQKWCKILKPYTGYAGLGLIQSVDTREKLRTIRQVYPLAKRFPGLDVDNPSIIANHIDGKIKGVNWLTVVSDQCLQSIGGRQGLISKLGKDFQIFDYDEGVIIQAGPTPQFGDVNRKNIPNHYCELSSMLKPLRMQFPEGHSFIRPGGQSGAEATNEWLDRFDE